MKLADVFLYSAIVAIITGVSAYDWRAGLIVGGVMIGVAGVLLSMR
jgi:hypothetical protein